MKRIGCRGGDVQRVWDIQARGCTFPRGMMRADAEVAARTRWPCAVVLAHEPLGGEHNATLDQQRLQLSNKPLLASDRRP